MQPIDLPVKDESQQRPIPLVWRRAFREIVDAFVQGDFGLSRRVSGVDPIDSDTASQISAYVESYGATLSTLPEATWDSSVCIWNGNRWDCLVDLWTQEEGRSDLVMHAHVIEDDGGHLIQVHLVYVP